MGHPVEL